jgi:UDP-glucose 4-epimerase
MEKIKIIVTGGLGWIGREVLRELYDSGIYLIPLGFKRRYQAPSVECLEFDIGSECEPTQGFLERIVGSSTVVHCAGYAHRPLETPEEVHRFWAINRDGTRRMLQLARRIGARRFVYLSSIASYDWAHDGEVPEEGPFAANTAYAASKLAGEQLCVESGLDWRVVRLGTVFGDGDRANFSKLAGALARRRFLLPGPGEARKSVLPLPLAARLIADLALRDEIPHRILNLALPEAPTLREICGAFSSNCGFPRPLSVPLGVLRPAARIGDRVARSRPNFPLTSVNLRKLTTSTVVNTRRMQETWPKEDWGDFARWLAPCADYYRSVAR